MSGPRALIDRHPRHLLAATLALGIAACGLAALEVLILALGLCVVLSALGARAHVALAAVALLVAGSAIGSARLASIDADPLRAAGSAELGLVGVLVELPRSDRFGMRFRLRERRSGQLLQVSARVASPIRLSIGDEVALRGRLARVDPAAARTPEARSYAEFLLRSGVRRRFFAESVVATGERRGGPLGAVDAIRRRAEATLAHGLPTEPAALLRGMVLGGDAGLPEQTAENFRVAGLAHILAVSGQNVLLIVILLQAILAAAGTPRRTRLVATAVVIVVYVLLCGAQASVIRAGAMGLAALAALAASRRASRIYALILAAICVLLINPRAPADVGAQLSFAAVLGIMAFTRPLADSLTALPRWASEAFAATLGATLATAPIMAFHFQAVSLVSLLANVLGEPLIAAIVWIGSLTAALGQLSTGLASLLGAPNGFLLATLIELARIAASVPGAQAELGGFGIGGLVAGLVAVCLLALLVNRPRLRRSLGRQLRGKPALVAPLLVIGALLLAGRAPTPPIRGPAIVMLDVGQGDATLLVGEGCTLLIDAGPPGERLGKQLRALGVRRLDALLITHAEDDHFGGALELARARELRVGTLIDGGGSTDRADYFELRGLLARAGARSIPAVAGTAWRCPGIALRVIGPPPAAPDAPPPAEPNARAAVTQVEVGSLRMLASGDAESPQLASLPLDAVDVLKVPHHGSADPGLGAVLARVRPRIALIGVGADNRYGHPAPTTLAQLAAVGARVLRTDRDGAITLRPGAQGAVAIEHGGGEE